MTVKNNLVVFLSLILLGIASQASATTGYFALGYGPKSNGMAGAVVAAPQDATTSAVNPAGMSLIEERADFSLMLFSPIREAALDPRVVGGSFEVRKKSKRDFFVIPNGGFKYQLNDQLSWGISFYANGGMNTTYTRNIFDETYAVLGAAQQGGGAAAAAVPTGTKTGMANTGTLQIDMGQGIIAPTLSYQITPEHSFGIAPLIGVQYFKAKGLGNFQGFTKNQTGTDLTNRTYDFAYGAGIRAGWIGQVHPMVTLGASASSKIYMTEFHQYSDLFAENGGFDIPANFTTGIALHPRSDLTLSFDYERIFYGDVKSIANKGPVFNPTSPFAGGGPGPDLPAGYTTLGADNGIGFGWDDIDVFRIGLQYEVNQDLTLRAGYSWNDRPFGGDQLLFNVIAPAVTNKHMTFGLSYSPSEFGEWNLSYQHAFKEHVSSEQTAFGVPGSLSMYQNAFEIGYSWKF
ncbi:MAG: outer membrane protein transport protein [Methylococcales bacterium]|nr:outer membrane protein transport protein [Methylococcales bacterium]